MNGHPEMQGMVFLCDAQGRVTELLRDDLGLGRASPVGRPLPAVVERESMAKALNFVMELRTKGAAFDWEINVRVDGDVLPLHFAGCAVKDAFLVMASRTRNGIMALYEQLMGITNEQMNTLRAHAKERTRMLQERVERDAGIYEEMSRLNNELATLQRELSKKNAELERLNEQKNRFLGMAAHDLRNPIGAIQTYSEFLLEEAASCLSEEHREFLAIIHASSQFMLRLIDDLLDVAKIEAGRLALDLQPIPIAAFVHHNVTVNRPIGKKKQVELLFRPEVSDADLPPLWIDPSKMDQVLNNLIGNALKFSPPGRAVEVGLMREGPSLVLSVRDQGPGIAPHIRSRLFEPFMRGGTGGTAGEPSTGLGLAIVKRIVEGHGGRVWAESREGEGAVFFVSLPAQGPERPPAKDTGKE